jgi:hypothetical protein
LDLEIEPPKRARYSKSMESPEIVEIFMEDDSDKELEELNELIEGSQKVFSSPPPPSSYEEEIEIEFKLFSVQRRRETTKPP